MAFQKKNHAIKNKHSRIFKKERGRKGNVLTNLATHTHNTKHKYQPSVCANTNTRLRTVLRIHQIAPSPLSPTSHGPHRNPFDVLMFFF